MRKHFLGLLTTTAILFGTPVASDSGSSFDRQQIENIVKEYILANPEIIGQAQQVLAERQELEERNKARQALAQNKAELFEPSFSPISGNPDGDVALVEFFDYQCGYCKRVMKDTADAVSQDGNVKMVYKEFPILGDVSVYAARAGLAVKMQNPELYEAFHLAVMGNKGRLSETAINKLADKVGADVDQMKSNMTHPDVLREIQTNYEIAQALGINGTPGFVIGDQIIPGAVSRQALDEAIAAARQE